MRVPTWLRWAGAIVATLVVTGFVGVLIWLLIDSERREAGTLTGVAGALIAGLLALERVGAPLWFQFRREGREQHGSRLDTFAQRDAVNRRISDLDEGGPYDGGSARATELAQAAEHRDYLTGVLTHAEVLKGVPRGVLSTESRDVPALDPDELERLRGLLATSSGATDVLDAEGWFLRGNAAFQAERHEEALAAYDRAIELRSDDADAHYNRGIVLGELDRHEQALAAYDRAVELRPYFPVGHYNRACGLGKLGNFEEALAALERAFELGYENWDLVESDDDLNLLRDHPEYGPRLRELIERHRDDDASP